MYILHRLLPKTPVLALSNDFIKQQNLKSGQYECQAHGAQQDQTRQDQTRQKNSYFRYQQHKAYFPIAVGLPLPGYGSFHCPWALLLGGVRICPGQEVCCTFVIFCSWFHYDMWFPFHPIKNKAQG